NDQSITEKRKVSAISILTAFCMIFVLSACVQKERAVQPETSTATVEWPSMENVQGKAFLEQCQESFDQVSSQFSALEEKKKFRNVNELLKDINRMDIVIDRAV